MRFSVLSSGSKANSTFIEGSGVKLLIDCGLSCREAFHRMALLGVDPYSLDGILVTHEHSDHIKGIDTLLSKLAIPLYCNELTYHALSKRLRKINRLNVFTNEQEFNIRGMSIKPFAIPHDAADPVGFAIKADEAKFVQVTDLGRVTTNIRSELYNANAIVLESNHDLAMLEECSYPWELKERIASAHGHLSNDSCSNLLYEVKHDGLRHVVLAHLSENSNTRDLALNATQTRFGLGNMPFGLVCGSINTATKLYRV